MRYMGNRQVHVIGIDCAVKDKKIGLAFGSFEGEVLKVHKALPGRPDEILQQLKDWIDPKVPALLAIDAPLGWPDPLGKALVNHRAGQPLDVAADLLFRRETDRDIRKRLERQSLDVGADRIARTAHRALDILAKLSGELGRSELPLAWAPSDVQQGVWAIEVYPAATLTAFGISIRGYKDLKEGTQERREILARLRKLLVLPEDLDTALVGCVDVLDAVVCLLSGADFLTGRATPPQDEQVALARKEGWIWCRDREPRQTEAGLDEALEEADQLAGRIARAWRSSKSALELLEEQRR